MAKTSGMIAGTPTMGNYDVYVLFDTGATHSLVSENFAEHLKQECWSLGDALEIS
ncbi:hypothetical protein HA396_27790, partial [Escherichia coli]|nr:hypothetical protein [Escherichia coli]